MNESKEDTGERPPMDPRVRRFFEGPSVTDRMDSFSSERSTSGCSVESRDENFNPFGDD
jgi:hypothetical protein